MKKLFILLTFGLFLSLNMKAESVSDYTINDESVEQVFATATPVIDFISSHNTSGVESIMAGEKSRMTAGILGLVVGCLGVHRFYLGHNTAGFVYLGWSLCSGVVIGVLSVVTAGIASFLSFLVPAAAVVGIVDGIMYLIADDAQFQSKYAGNTKIIQWL